MCVIAVQELCSGSRGTVKSHQLPVGGVSPGWERPDGGQRASSAENALTPFTYTALSACPVKSDSVPRVAACDLAVVSPINSMGRNLCAFVECSSPHYPGIVISGQMTHLLVYAVGSLNAVSAFGVAVVPCRPRTRLGTLPARLHALRIPNIGILPDYLSIMAEAGFRVSVLALASNHR